MSALAENADGVVAPVDAPLRKPDWFAGELSADILGGLDHLRACVEYLLQVLRSNRPGGCTYVQSDTAS